MDNLDRRTADGFDRIWARHGEASTRAHECDAFHAYFDIFPKQLLAGAEGFDLGCGNGRIAGCVAPLVRRLHCIDPSAAGLRAAAAGMRHLDNVTFHQASAGSIPLADDSQDFGYSIGVLHHVPDPEAGLASCVRKLKPGAPFLLYLYYDFDNRPGWFRRVWRASDIARRGVSRLPFPLRTAASTLLAATAYWPLSRSARLLERLGVSVENVPLSYYRNHDWTDLRADALDRFGTTVEHRFSRARMDAMMRGAGLENIRFSNSAPYWVAVGFKR